ncbi:MAG: hypothetical protein ACRYGJ_02055 [Janthinobacterium lividum]
MNNITILISLVVKLEPNAWVDQLSRVFTSNDVTEISGNPKINRVSFILGMAKLRKENSLKLGLKTFGLENLIPKLERLSPDDKLETYGIENGLYTGSCFVRCGEIIGCEFVARGLARTIPYNG